MPKVSWKDFINISEVHIYKKYYGSKSVQWMQTRRSCKYAGSFEFRIIVFQIILPELFLCCYCTIARSKQDEFYKVCLAVKYVLKHVRSRSSSMFSVHRPGCVLGINSHYIICLRRKHLRWDMSHKNYLKQDICNLKFFVVRSKN